MMKSWGKKTHLTLSLENAFIFLCIKPQETRKTPFTPYMIMEHRTTRTKLWRPTDCEWVRMKERISWGHLCVPPSHCLSLIPQGMEVCLIEKGLFFSPCFCFFVFIVVKTHKQEFRLSRGRGADFKLYKITGWGGDGSSSVSRMFA